MYSFIYTTRFKKDIKLCQKRNYDFEEFKVVLQTLEKTGKLPSKYKPHTLSGNYKKSLGMSHKTRLAFDLVAR